MDTRKKELLESQALKTLDKLQDKKTLEVLSFVQNIKEQGLFFDEFYQMIFYAYIPIIQQDQLVEWLASFENFSLSSEQASIYFSNYAKNNYYKNKIEIFGTRIPNICEKMNKLLDKNIYLHESCFLFLQQKPKEFEDLEAKSKSIENMHLLDKNLPHSFSKSVRSKV